MKKNYSKAHNICTKCAIEFASYGCPCIVLMELLVSKMLVDECAVYDEKTFKDISIIKQAVKFLESKKYLISTEVDQTSIAIYPNLSTCKFNYETNILCWCELHL
jgi:hypothetical protein